MLLPGRILFRRYSVGSESDGTLFVSATDGSHEQRAATPGAGESLENPVWAPGGGLLYTQVGPGDSQRMVLSTGGRTTRLTAGLPTRGSGPFVPGLDSQGVFSPDGQLIAYQHGSGTVANDQLQFDDIWLMDAMGGHRRSLTHGAAYSGDRDGLAWSPDGTRLVFSLSVSATGTPANGHALFIIDADGTNLRRLTPWNLGAGGPPDWSSRDLVAFRAVQDDESGIGNFFTIHPDGSRLQQVTHFTDTVVSHKVSFSPDGQWIAFSRSVPSGGADVYIASVDGKQLHPVTQTPETESSPDWGP